MELGRSVGEGAAGEVQVAGEPSDHPVHVVLAETSSGAEALDVGDEVELELQIEGRSRADERAEAAR